MTTAWYLIPYYQLLFGGRPTRGVDLVRGPNSLSDRIKKEPPDGDGGWWTESEVMGGPLGQAVVKVLASADTHTAIEDAYKKLGNDRADVLTRDRSDELQAELRSWGYGADEVGTQILTLGEFLDLATQRRIESRLNAAKDSVIVDGIHQPCRSIDSVDREVR